jgi:aconitase B
MAEVARDVQRPGAGGAEPVQIEGLLAPDTQLIPNKNGDVVLRVINGGAEATNVTIATPGEVGGNAVADRVVAVAAGKTKLIGPFDPETYNDKHGNLVVTFSKVTTVKLEATKVA